MLNELSHYNNLGTPEYFFQLVNTINENVETTWTIIDLKQSFYNKTINARYVFDGCIDLAIKTKILILVDNTITLNNEITNSLNSQKQMSDKFVEFLFRAIKDDDSFYGIFQTKHLSYDIIYKSFQIRNAAFAFKFSNFKQLLIDFGVINTHPTPEIKNYIINPRYRKLFDKTLLPEIRKRQIGIEEFKKNIEKQQIYGEKAEKFVLLFENKRLNGNQTIDWIAEYIVNEGYDIASYNEENDNEYNRFIEVKSYEGNKPYFYWSKNEYQVAKRKQNTYWLYLVNRKEMSKDDYKPIMEQNPYENILKSDNWNKQVDKYRIELSQEET